MKRRNWIKQTAIGAASAALPFGVSNFMIEKKQKKVLLKVAHITDVHIRSEENALERFTHCLEQVKKHDVDFFLNGGDSIYAADYDDIKRARVQEQWALWNKATKSIQSYEIYSCLGNHDMWWAAPSKEDEMYGKDYVVEQLNIPARYYSFSKNGWHFIILDGNNENISLDDEQFQWLKNELEQLPANTPVLLMSHYPILGISPHWEGGMHSDYKELKDLFYQHKDKVRVCLSGHNHLLDSASYNGVDYFCNGAVCGFWWEKGNEKSAGSSYYQETPPGYAILSLYDDGTVENQYHTY